MSDGPLAMAMVASAFLHLASGGGGMQGGGGLITAGVGWGGVVSIRFSGQDPRSFPSALVGMGWSSHDGCAEETVDVCCGIRRDVTWSIPFLCRELIRAVRACKTAAEERDTVAKECAAVRTAFKVPNPPLSGVWDLGSVKISGVGLGFRVQGFGVSGFGVSGVEVFRGLGQEFKIGGDRGARFVETSCPVRCLGAK